MKEKRFIYPLLVGVLLNFCNCNKLEILEAKQYITKTEQEESEGFKVENSNYAYVTNTNGIVFYKTLMDLKSKLKNIPYGEKIIFTYEPLNSEAEESNFWYSIDYKGTKGYVYSIEPYKSGDWFTLNTLTAYNEDTKANEVAYSMVIFSNTIFYELPSLDSKPLGVIDAFNLVSVLASGSSYDSFISNNIDLEMGGSDRIWYEVTFNGKRGFVLNGINYPTTKTIAEMQVKDQIINQKGYFLLATKEPMLYDMETKQPLQNNYSIKVLKENIFFDSTESRLLNGEQVYQIYLSEKLDIRLKKKFKKIEEEERPYIAYISSKDGTYLTEQKFSDYTVVKTRFKGDLNAISVMRDEFEKRGIYLNYLDFSLRKISEGSLQDSFFVASAHVGYYDSEPHNNSTIRSIILRQVDGVYEPVSGSIYTSAPIQFKDLDNDGVKEMIVKSPTRGGEETVIYGLKDGKYISMNTILNGLGIYEIELSGTRIKGKKWISAPDGNDSKEEIHYFKYQNASFVETKK